MLERYVVLRRRRTIVRIFRFRSRGFNFYNYYQCVREIRRKYLHIDGSEEKEKEKTKKTKKKLLLRRTRTRTPKD